MVPADCSGVRAYPTKPSAPIQDPPGAAIGVQVPSTKSQTSAMSSHARSGSSASVIGSMRSRSNAWNTVSAAGAGSSPGAVAGSVRSTNSTPLVPVRHSLRVVTTSPDCAFTKSTSVVLSSASTQRLFTSIPTPSPVAGVCTPIVSWSVTTSLSIPSGSPSTSPWLCAEASFSYTVGRCADWSSAGSSRGSVGPEPSRRSERASNTTFGTTLKPCAKPSGLS